jgi:hypothetical protein
MIAIYVSLALLSIVTISAVLFLALFRRTPGVHASGTEWLDEFTIERYRPLDRLFDPDDLQFAEAHPGYTASLGRKLASSRRAAARLFLAELTSDFDRMVRLGREMLLASRQDRPDLLATLVRQWTAFHFRIFVLRVRLVLAPLGLAPRRPVGLLDALTRMRNVVAILEVSAQARA